MEQELNISNSEMVVMRVVWSLGEAKVEDVMHQVSKRQDWSLATVKTLMGRLVKKEILTTVKNGRAFTYYPALSECGAVRQMTSDLLGKVCATKQNQIVSDMIEMSELTEADISKLIAQLQKKKVVEKVMCSCLDDDSCHCMHNQVELA
ncbi:MAG: CopY/TcrY family copper transport repressor [Streptococcaceae bacterium]|jgi:CopY/TcrY family copper transport repressor|nr:CopY/TcrY family copper transport repressor [Streptococcaceae bacterium]